MIHGKCGYNGCQYDIKPGETQAKFNRNKGVHLRTAHGVPGSWNTRQRKKITNPVVEMNPKMDSISQEAVRRQHRREYQAEYRERKKKERQQQLSSVNNSAAKLKFICPDCGARIFTTSAP